jgi:hypothetical protein
MQKDMLFYRSLETQDRSLLVFQQILFASYIAKARSAIFIEYFWSINLINKPLSFLFEVNFHGEFTNGQGLVFSEVLPRFQFSLRLVSYVLQRGVILIIGNLPLMHTKESMMILCLSVFDFTFMEIVHIQLNVERITCLWKEVRLECLK